MNKQLLNPKLLSNSEIKNIIKADKIEERDEYLIIKDIKIQEIQNINPNFDDKTNTIPKKVATPFPPLNFNQTGNI